LRRPFLPHWGQGMVIGAHARSSTRTHGCTTSMLLSLRCCGHNPQEGTGVFFEDDHSVTQSRWASSPIKVHGFPRRPGTFGSLKSVRTAWSGKAETARSAILVCRPRLTEKLAPSAFTFRTCRRLRRPGLTVRFAPARDPRELRNQRRLSQASVVGHNLLRAG
jgi:hypothetical protein